MGIVGLWKVLVNDQEASFSGKGRIFVDGMYLAIRVATAMQTVKDDVRHDITLKTVQARRKHILDIAASEYIIVFDGHGVGDKKLPRSAISASPEVISTVISAINAAFAGAFTIIQLQPGMEADDYIIAHATESDMIISDDSDMLISPAIIRRFDGRMYTRQTNLMTLSGIIGRDVTDEMFVEAIRRSKNDKTNDGATFMSALRSV